MKYGSSSVFLPYTNATCGLEPDVYKGGAKY